MMLSAMYIPFVMIRLNFLPRDDSIKRGLSRHAVSVCLSVCLSVCHVRTYSLTHSLLRLTS